MVEIVTRGTPSIAEEPIRQHIVRLRAEVIEISRRNKEYLHSRHPLAAVQRHKERRKRLEQIVAELRILSTHGSELIDLG